MVVRGATGRKLPYGRVNIGDCLYFINNNADGVIKSCAIVSSVYNSEKMTEWESSDLIIKNQKFLSLTEKQIERWSGKRYMVLIGVEGFKKISPFNIDKRNYGNMDDWLLVGDIENVKIS